jgi:hypothetical protein
MAITAADDDAGRLGRILSQIAEPADRVWLAERIEPRQCRIKRRNEAIRAALWDHFEGKPGMLADALGGYASTCWRFEREMPVLPDMASLYRVALHQILRLSDGKVLCTKQLRNIGKSKSRNFPPGDVFIGHEHKAQFPAR